MFTRLVCQLGTIVIGLQKRDDWQLVILATYCNSFEKWWFHVLPGAADFVPPLLWQGIPPVYLVLTLLSIVCPC